MDLMEVEIEQNTSTDLKHLGFVKEIALKFLAVLSNVYDFAKENIGDLETNVVSAELKAVVSAVKPAYQKLKDFAEQILLFVDDKFDKYAPDLIKNLVAKLQSLIDKTIPLVGKLLTTVQSLVAPLITTTIDLLKKVIKPIKSLLQKVIEPIKSLLKKVIDPIKSLIKKVIEPIKSFLLKIFSTIKSLLLKILTPLVSKLETLLAKGVSTLTSLIQPAQLVDTAQSLVKEGSDLANQALDTTKSVVGGIPLVGDAAQSLITNSTDLAGQMLDTTTSLVKENPAFDAVNSAAQNIIKEAQGSGLKAALKSAYLTFNVVGLPVIAQYWYKANKYPLFHALAEVILPVAELVSEWYNKVVSYMVGKGYSLFDYFPLVPINEMKAAYKVVKAAMDGLSAVGNLVGVN